ncbi:GNAT family N-acetyltransferase [Limimaricola pyoseonensis]|uniref:L-ornithine N(alpha)-acyltransferase n=1 Tax=Limimaricola pyoseonensis TaxID=521013 RepID=A0A1G7A3Q7_9RHOB|nr:GNAT family N-acyltransferase [Limimaricola pyoseonensis]SDE09167.1 Putative hemolysin [Limimaricola pyoseonensis]
MIVTRPQLTVRLARDADDILAAARLRYAVFVEELGGTGAGVDHAARVERDRFDAVAEHLLLVDEARPAGDQVVGLYRLLSQEGAAQIGQFYSEDEFDLRPLHRSGRRLLELGRSCLHPDYRGGGAMFRLWQGLAEHVERRGVELLFGTASFPGTRIADVAGSLSLLHRAHLAPEELRVISRDQPAPDLLPEERVDRAAAMRAMPALIKAYLRLGGQVGQGVFIDHDFNCMDVCMLLDLSRVDARQTALYRTPQ